jgi:hypothetical protein
MGVTEIGCCGAYCGTCPVFRNKLCRGCKTGYSDGSRQIAKARCRIKVCCIGKQHHTCADCDAYASCPVIQNFYNKNGYKYKKYKEAIDFIRVNSYREFIRIADTWSMQYGKYK